MGKSAIVVKLRSLSIIVAQRCNQDFTIVWNEISHGLDDKIGLGKARVLLTELTIVIQIVCCDRLNNLLQAFANYRFMTIFSTK